MVQMGSSAQGAGVVLLLALWLSLVARAQEQATLAETPQPQNAGGDAASSLPPVKPVPMVTGFGAFIPTWEGGAATLVTIFTPVVLVPLGDRFLMESRGSFEGDFTRPAPGEPFQGPINKTVDYVQLDYIASKYATLTVGRFLTPFGMFNERFYPNWIRNLQTDPLILPMATSSNDGFMARGGFPLNGSVNLNYSAYFSTLSTVRYFESERAVGGRAGLFFPGPRLEVGASVEHFLQDDHSNIGGFHLEWQPRPLPLTLRTEYEYSENGKGWYLEGAYMLSQASFWQKVMRHTQVVGRVQSFYLGKNGSAGAANLGLPDSDTTRAEVGINYFLMDGLKAVSSYGRTFSGVDGNSNIWTVGVAYRFAFPLGHGR